MTWYAICVFSCLSGKPTGDPSASGSSRSPQASTGATKIDVAATTSTSTTEGSQDRGTDVEMESRLITKNTTHGSPDEPFDMETVSTFESTNQETNSDASQGRKSTSRPEVLTTIIDDRIKESSIKIDSTSEKSDSSSTRINEENESMHSEITPTSSESIKGSTHAEHIIASKRTDDAAPAQDSSIASTELVMASSIATERDMIHLRMSPSGRTVGNSDGTLETTTESSGSNESTKLDMPSTTTSRSTTRSSRRLTKATASTTHEERSSSLSESTLRPSSRRSSGHSLMSSTEKGGNIPTGDTNLEVTTILSDNRDPPNKSTNNNNNFGPDSPNGQTTMTMSPTLDKSSDLSDMSPPSSDIESSLTPQNSRKTTIGLVSTDTFSVPLRKG